MSTDNTPQDKPIWEIIVESMKDVPPEELARLPTDIAEEHDHCIYGTPKRGGGAAAGGTMVGSLVIEVSPEMQSELQEQARKRGVSVPALARDVIGDFLAHERKVSAEQPKLSPEERRARVQAARGCMEHLPGSVDDFLRRKHEENEREEEKWDRRQRERANTDR